MKKPSKRKASRKPREWYIVIDCLGNTDGLYAHHEYKSAKKTKDWLNEYGCPRSAPYRAIKVREVLPKRRGVK